MKLKAITLIVVALVMAAATPVYAADIPPLPHAFYGDLTINDNPAPAGTTVEARGEGVRMDISGNPIVTTEVGEYGSADPLGSKLVVQGDIADGATITFYVNDEPTGQTAEWHSGEVTELDLSVTITVPGPPGPTYYYIQTNLFGIEKRYRIKSDGELLQTIEATSEDGMLTLTIPEETVTLDEDDNRLETLEGTINETPPNPPEDAYIVGLAYDFTPDGATFDPPLTLTWSYDPDLPEDVAEEDLVVAYYDEDAGNWVEVDFVVDTENDTITGSVSHFTTFAIIGSVTPLLVPADFSVSSLSVQPAEVEPGETVAIAVSVANTGGESGSYTVVLKIDEVKEDEERVTIAAGSSRTVSFSVTREEAGSYTVTVDRLSGSFTVVAPVVVVPLEPADFSVSSLSVLPAEVEPGETVTIAVSVANTGGKSGSYNVVLKIDGVKEAEETVTVAAGESQEVSFSVIREEAGSYTVALDGLSGSFTVVAPPVGEEEEEEEVPIKPGINWPVLGGIIGGVVIALGLLYYFLVFRRRDY